MIKIDIGNSYSRITGLSAKDEKALKSALSYTVGGSAAYFSGYGIHKKSLLNKRGEFPTGLLHRVNRAFPAAQVADLRVKPLWRPPQTSRKSHKPYEAQLNALDAAMASQRGTISMPTGTGKSLVIALITARLNVKTLVVVPTLEIKRQLTESLIDVLGAYNKVTVENIDSGCLKHMGPGFECLIIDEAHHAAAKTYQKLNKTMWQNIYYRYFLTATPFRNDTEETLLFEAIAGQVIYKLDYRTAISKGYIVPVEAYYIDLPKYKTDAYTWAEVYKELIVNNQYRNQVILDLMLKLSLAGKSALCLVKEVQHGHNTYHPHFVHGEDAVTRGLITHFNSGKIKTLVATTGIMGEGVDTKPCEYVIIAGLGKAKSQFMQQVGRAVRKYPGKESAKIIIFRDTSHKFCLRHFAAQKKILLDEYGVHVSKLNL